MGNIFELVGKTCKKGTILEYRPTFMERMTCVQAKALRGHGENVILYTTHIASRKFPCAARLWNKDVYRVLRIDRRLIREEDAALESLRFVRIVIPSDVILYYNRLIICVDKCRSLSIIPNGDYYHYEWISTKVTQLPNGEYPILSGKYKDEILRRFLELTSYYKNDDIQTEDEFSYRKSQILDWATMISARYLARKHLKMC